MIRTDGRASAVSPVDRLVAEAVPLSPTSDVSCVAMVEADRPAAVLWRRCVLRGRTTYDGAPAAFSPDGRLLLVQGRSQTYGERPFAAVLDARTGDVKARFDQGRYGSDQVGAEYEEWQAVFEDDTHVLFVVADRVGQTVGRSRQAIVRCDVAAATCELATIPRLSTPHTTRPYFLVG